MTSNANIDAYMRQFETALRRYALKQQSEIASDLRSHIQEAIDYGKTPDETLNALGAPEALARAYAVELLVDAPRDQRPSGAWRALKLIGLVAAGGIVTYVVVVSLGAISLSFMASGLLLFGVGLIEAAGIHLPHVQLANLPPLAVAAMGPLCFAIGYGAGALLWRYVRFLVRTVRAALPRKAQKTL